MQRSIFITGGTGMIGQELFKQLLLQTEDQICLLVHEHGQGKTAEQLMVELGVPNKTEYAKRLTVVEGDITKSNLGLSPNQYQNLAAQTDHILHLAASTRFDLTLEVARRINVTGTANVLKLAKNTPNLKQFGFVSTVYVSGKRTGLITEEVADNPVGFVNTYEQTKYEAEKLIESNINLIPAAIYRLSTVIGDSRDGTVSHFTAPHQTIRMMYAGLASLIPGQPDYPVDLISSDYSAAAINRLFLEHFATGQIFHIVAGAEQSYRLEGLINQSFDIIGRLYPDWAARNYPKPVIASTEAFDLFLHSAEESNNMILIGVLNALKHFAHQLNYPKDFSYKNTLATLPFYGRDLPKIEDFYPKVIEYCIRSNWGKNV